MSDIQERDIARIGERHQYAQEALEAWGAIPTAGEVAHKDRGYLLDAMDAIRQELAALTMQRAFWESHAVAYQVDLATLKAELLEAKARATAFFEDGASVRAKLKALEASFWRPHAHRAEPVGRGAGMNEDIFARTDWITTYSGYPFFPLAPRSEDVRIADIAHALSNLCRFAGHTRRFYSVAQHSVIVSRIVEREHALWALLHDASEAYLCDVISPVKRQGGLKGYREIERLVQDAICMRFGLPVHEPTQVKVADTLLLRTEQRDLMAMPDGWRPSETLPMTIVPLTPHDAERAFLIRFHELTGAN